MFMLGNMCPIIDILYVKMAKYNLNDLFYDIMEKIHSILSEKCPKLEFPKFL